MEEGVTKEVTSLSRANGSSITSMRGSNLPSECSVSKQEKIQPELLEAGGLPPKSFRALPIEWKAIFDLKAYVHSNVRLTFLKFFALRSAGRIQN